MPLLQNSIDLVSQFTLNSILIHWSQNSRVYGTLAEEHRLDLSQPDIL